MRWRRRASSARSSCILWSCGSSRWLYTPAVRSSRMQLADARQLSARPRASPFLSQKVLQRRIVQHGVGQQPLQPGVLVLQRLQPLGLRDIHPAELRFPFVDTGVADAMLAAQIGDRNAGLVLLQNPDDLLFRKTTALHALVLVVGQSELQPGLSQRGNVTAGAGRSPSQ